MNKTLACTRDYTPKCLIDFDMMKWLVPSVTVYNIFATLTFLMYNQVYKENKSRDQETAVFQIIDHFYKINKKYTKAIWIWYGIAAVVYFLDSVFLSYPFVILGFPIVVILCAVTEVNQLLLALFVIQRFCLYFFPSTEKCLNFSRMTMNLIIILAYGVSSLEFALVVFLYFKFPQSTSSFFQIYNISLQTFLITSAALYVPIFISIKKLRNLTSAQINKPQRFVAMHLIVIASEKLILVPVFMVFYTIPIKTLTFDTYIVRAKVVDVLLMPIITQVTYLCCNRRNVMTLWKTLKPNCCKSNAVDPNVPLNYMEHMETTRQ